MKFEVKCTGYKTPERYFTVGKIYTWEDGRIKCDDGFEFEEMVDGPDPKKWRLSDWYAFELLNESKIVILRDNDKTLARLYEGNKVIKSAEAKCSPTDTYDFSIGARLAMDRLIGGTEFGFTSPHFKAMFDDAGSSVQTFTVEPFKGVEPLKHQYKVGDKVKVTKPYTHCFPIGTVVRLVEDGHTPKWKAEYLDGHDHWYVRESDIEPYTEPQDKPPTQYREVKRVAKEGEWVKILPGASGTVGSHVGEVFKAISSTWIEIDGKVYPAYDQGEYVVCEPIVFPWDAFRSGQIAVHCDTEEKAKAFLKECDTALPDLRWIIGKKPSDFSRRDDQIIGVKRGYLTATRAAETWYAQNGYTIINYPDLTPYVEPDPLADYEWVEGYKGFNADLTCKGFQYEIGKEYDLGEEEKMCDRGFHFCKTLDEVHKFYSDNGKNRFCKVSGLVKKGFAYSDKWCARKIKIVDEVKKDVWLNCNVICTNNPSSPFDGWGVVKGGEYSVVDGYFVWPDGSKTRERYKSIEDMHWATFIESAGKKS